MKPTPLLLLALLLSPSLPLCAQEEAEAASDDPVVTQEDLESWTLEILGEIEELREKKFPRSVSVAVANKAQFMEYMQARMDKSMTPERLESEETTAKLLGMIPGDMDYMATMTELVESQVGGFYDPETEGFFLMERFGGPLAKTILAHELTHALDDQLYDIDGTLEGIAEERVNSDAEFAYHAVVEGSGTAIMNAWTIGKVTSGEISLADMQNVDLGTESLEEAIPYMWKPLLGVYLRGAAFLNRTTSVMEGQVKTPALPDFHTAFATPPISSEQVLHPEKYWDPKKRDDPIRVDLNLADLPDGWGVLHEDTLGEFSLALLVEPPAKRKGLKGQLAMLGTKYTYPAAEGWGGDRYAFLANGDARAVLCETVWDTADEAAEFREALQGLGEHLRGAAASTANAHELGESGFTFGARGERGVWLRSWIGAADIEALAASITTSIGEQ